MKIIAFLAFLALCGWGLYAWMQKEKQAAQKQSDNAAVRYAQSLHSAEQRAQGAADVANKTISQQVNSVNEAVSAPGQ